MASDNRCASIRGRRAAEPAPWPARRAERLGNRSRLVEGSRAIGVHLIERGAVEAVFPQLSGYGALSEDWPTLSLC